LKIFFLLLFNEQFYSNWESIKLNCDNSLRVIFFVKRLSLIHILEIEWCFSFLINLLKKKSRCCLYINAMYARAYRWVDVGMELYLPTSHLTHDNSIEFQFSCFMPKYKYIQLPRPVYPLICSCIHRIRIRGISSWILCLSLFKIWKFSLQVYLQVY
jgi:hypothetical protein